MPGDNIYPDLSNDKFDIQYARLLGLSSDLKASFGVVEEAGGVAPPNGLPFETPSDVDTGIIRFGVATEDDTAAQNRSFDLAGAYSFALTQLGNNQFLVDPANGLYQLGAIPVPGSDSGLSYSYLEIDDTTGKIRLQAPGGVILPGYGYGNHIGTERYRLAVDIDGNIIEVTGAGGSGTVTNFIFTDANGFDGTVTSSTTTPTLSLTTTLTAGSVFFAGAAGAINEDNSNLFFDNTNNILGIGVNSSFGATRLSVVDNGVAGASIVKVSSTSTAAASDIQRGIDSQLSGANSNGGQLTAAIYGSNTHTGTTSENVGVMGVANSGSTSNSGVYGTSSSTSGVSAGVRAENTSTGFGIVASSTGSGTAGNFSTGTGYAVDALSSLVAVHGVTTGGSGGVGVIGQAQNDSAYGLSAFNFAPSTNTIVPVLEIRRTSFGTGANGIGAAINFNIQNASTLVQSNQITAHWVDATNATRISALTFVVVTDADTHNGLFLSGPQSTLLSRDSGTNQTVERFSVAGAYKTLTESSATAFVRINIPTGTVTGGQILITVEANDATDFQSRTLRFIWTAVNKGGTITAQVQTPEEIDAVSTGTLTVSIDTNDAGSGNLDFRANAVSSLTQSVLRCSYQVFKNIGAGVITPQ